MRLFWKRFVAPLKESKLALGLFCFVVVGSLALVLSGFAYVFAHVTDGANLFADGNMKWAVENRVDLGKALLWELTILDKDKEKAEIIEKASQAGIVVIDNSSNAGVKDIILLKGLESAVNILPFQIFDTINGPNSGAFRVVICNENGFEEAIRNSTASTYYKEILKSHEGFYVSTMNSFFIWENSFGFGWYQYAFIHDIGHAYHWSLGDWNYIPPDLFTDIREKEELPNEYAKENYLEDFAETFAHYFLKPDYLKQKSPLRYEWMEKHFAND